MAAKKSKPVLVLLHGLGGGAADWADAGVPLAKHFAIQALDLPGSLRGPKSPDGYEPAALARWVLGVLPDEPVFLAGHAGGTIKGNLHVRCPDSTPMANIYLTMLHKLGVNVERFGDSTGEVAI